MEISVKFELDKTYSNFLQKSNDIYNTFMLKIDGEMTRRNRLYLDMNTNFELRDQKITFIENQTKGFMDL